MLTELMLQLLLTLNILVTIIIGSVSFIAYKAFRFTKDTKYKIFSISFGLLCISQLIRSIELFFLFYGSDPIRIFSRPIAVFYLISMIISYCLLIIGQLKKKAIFISIIFLLIMIIYFFISFEQINAIALFLLLLLMVLHLKKYLKVKNIELLKIPSVIFCLMLVHISLFLTHISYLFYLGSIVSFILSSLFMITLLPRP
jgi:hypothetical protein